MSLGDRLKEWRDKRGLTQEQLAIKCGVSQPMIVKIEKGESGSSPKTIKKIANALGIPQSFLTEENPELLGEAYRIAELIKDLDPETRKILGDFKSNEYLIFLKNVKNEDISIEELRAALELIRRVKKS